MMRYYLILSILFLNACTLFKPDSNSATFEFGNAKIKFRYYNLIPYSTFSVREGEYGSLASASYANNEWYFSTMAYGTNNENYYSITNRDFKFENYMFELQKNLLRDTISLEGQTGEMYSYYVIDSAMGEGHYFKYRSFFLIENDLTLECSISKYHYTPSDDTTFQNIINSFEIIRE